MEPSERRVRGSRRPEMRRGAHAAEESSCAPSAGETRRVSEASQGQPP
jgi:hypothetical protein